MAVQEVNKEPNSEKGNASGKCEAEESTMFTKLLFLNLSSAGVFGDERLLPAVFQELSVAFHASLSQLGALTFAGAISQALSFPLGTEIFKMEICFLYLFFSPYVCVGAQSMNLK